MADGRGGDDPSDAKAGTSAWRRALGLGAVAAGLAGAAVVVMRRRQNGEGHAPASDGPDAEAIAAGHETHDMDAAGLAKIIAGFGVTVAACVGLMFWMIGFFVHRDLASRPPLTPQEQAQIEPPGPHLVVQPLRGIAELRTREDHLLSSYAWVGPDHKLARIPIDRAMKLVNGRPLDPQPQGGDAAPGPVPPR